MSIKRVKFDDIKKQKGTTKKSDLDVMTDAEINRRALADKDSAVPSKRDLEQFHHSPIHPFTHSPIHPFTHSPIHPFTHSPKQLKE